MPDGDVVVVREETTVVVERDSTDVLVEDASPADVVVVAAATGPAGKGTPVFVGPTLPLDLPPAYVWFETNGVDMTVWVEDGAP